MQLFLLFIVIPLVELFLLLRVGAIIGALNTIALVIITAAVGAYYARSEGMSVVYRMQQMTARGEVPTVELVDALMIFGGGALLLTPGFLTDALGLACILPMTRPWMRQAILGHYRSRIRVYHTGESHPEQQSRRSQQNQVIDVDFKEEKKESRFHDQDRSDRQ
ncbi:FxsA cytoplasmic membrane protein [Desulfurispirillum indicum S5]|uniref:FxsA cytoplasmic membrane protein n=1 Tax=Desulfurispirillum indicum (strain ATCC BAA-1389 / DSM 22839 / S5) TaxID=653733 RepID=E6W045_DESIS|nr:FxsA family protein [Desulfurispirillum indicum]ADU65171.1 FxsA cytoplasmic membrane protein [Desulfurispirillum indicum S5]